jgi:alkylation response protein AidB-like acyl-CoA dehydrogenase
MAEYIAPIREMRFVIEELAGLGDILSQSAYRETPPDILDAVLDEAAKLASQVLSPLNYPGDQQGPSLKAGVVTAAQGFKAAYRQLVDNGWLGLSGPVEFDGQGLPKLIATAVGEMWKSANMSIALCPMLTQSAIEALQHAASDELKNIYLPKLVSGEWTGTMNLTEPQAGSDLAAIRSRAIPDLSRQDGSYRIFGQKIFITWGEHDMADNIIHLVLARTPNAPEGVKGISLFVVPKYLVNIDGSLGERNDVVCIGLEHKLGIIACPTASLSFGENGGAIGFLVGEENRGLEYMFAMMNAARLGVGMEGVAISERARQRAVAYAQERIQGTEVGVPEQAKVAIIRHPDVRRMLMAMRAQTEAIRALAYVATAARDLANHGNPAEQVENQALVDLLTPVVKGWSTETALEVTSLGIQVHGGVGYMEETGAAQHFRDARITTIYEGTTAIQANDLIGRKIARNNGETIRRLCQQMRTLAADLAASRDDALQAIAERFARAIASLEVSVDWLLEHYRNDPKLAHASAVPFLKLFGTVAGGWQMARAAQISAERIAEGSMDPFYQTKIGTARFFADHFLVLCPGLSEVVTAGAGASLTVDEEFL